MKVPSVWQRMGSLWEQVSSLVLYRGQGIDGILTPFPDVIDELYRRQNDPELRRRVEKYLKDDLPDYLTDKPVLYLARHLATRNFETMRFLNLVEPLELPVVISQDLEDKFVANNVLKRVLGKLPICISIRNKNNQFIEEYKNLTIVDFATADGKKFKDITTVWGQPLIEFHTELLTKFTREGVDLTDDSAWITRHHRGDISQHYKDFLAFFICHGVLFEDYLLADKEEAIFFREVLRPAFKHVEKVFGLKPLITQLVPTTPESGKFWISYPKDVLDIVEQKMHTSSIV